MKGIVWLKSLGPTAGDRRAPAVSATAVRSHPPVTSARRPRRGAAIYPVRGVEKAKKK
jgi:hypothetical protein